MNNANTATHEASIRNVLGKTEQGRKYLDWINALDPADQQTVIQLAGVIMRRCKAVGPLKAMGVILQLGRFLYLSECRQEKLLYMFTDEQTGEPLMR